MLQRTKTLGYFVTSAVFLTNPQKPVETQTLFYLGF